MGAEVQAQAAVLPKKHATGHQAAEPDGLRGMGSVSVPFAALIPISSGVDAFSFEKGVG